MRIDGDMPYANHEHHPRFLGDHCHGSAGTYHLLKSAEEAKDSRIAFCKELLQREAAAGMPHIPRHEACTAGRTFPEWLFRWSHRVRVEDLQGSNVLLPERSVPSIQRQSTSRI